MSVQQPPQWLGFPMTLLAWAGWIVAFVLAVGMLLAPDGFGFFLPDSSTVHLTPTIDRGSPITATATATATEMPGSATPQLKSLPIPVQLTNVDSNSLVSDDPNTIKAIRSSLASNLVNERSGEVAGMVVIHIGTQGGRITTDMVNKEANALEELVFALLRPDQSPVIFTYARYDAIGDSNLQVGAMTLDIYVFE